MIFVASLIGLASLSNAAEMTAEQKAVMDHASPMPNLMMAVAKNQEQLKLTEEQKEALANWVDYSKPRVQKMVKAVGELEKQLHDAALAGAPGSALQRIASQSLNARATLMKQKLACRNNLARILTQEQLQQTIELYKEIQS
jgi:hypothetical protein